MFASSEVWLLQSVGGIQPAPDARGFDKVLIKPAPPAGLTHASASYHTHRGRISTSWTKAAASTGLTSLKLTMTIPPNVAATVHVPTVSGRVRDAETGLLLLVCPHAHLQIVQLPLSASPVATLQGRRESGSMVVEVGSGDWTFEADF